MGELTKRGAGLKVLAGEGAAIDTTTANGRLVFGFFAALAEFERELIVERTKAGLVAAEARGRVGGNPLSPFGAIPCKSGRRLRWPSQATAPLGNALRRCRPAGRIAAR